LIELTTLSFPGTFDGIIYNGAVLVHKMKPQSSRTFAEYCEHEFLPSILWNALRLTTSRMDIVWDIYNDASLKSTTCVHRGSGVCHQAAKKLAQFFEKFVE